MPRRLILIVILVVYFFLGTLFAVKTPAWQAPDEPAHYNYIGYLAENCSFPVLHRGDYPHGYLEEIKGAGFPPDMPITPIRYESHQPPLYYVLATPIYALTDGSLPALRLFSVLLGMGIVSLAYGIARRTLPERPAVALGAAAFVAFLPQHLATVSQVGNDVLAELLLASALFALVVWIAPPAEAGTKQRLLPLVLGVLLGIVLVTKTTAFIAVPLVLGVMVWRWFRQRAPLRQVVVEGLAVILPTALIALPWLVRNIYVYGWPYFLCLIRHDQIVIGQARTAQYIAENGWDAYWQRAGEWTFKSFVGVFGWMGVWLDIRIYNLLGLWLAVPGIAAVVSIFQRRRQPWSEATTRAPAVILLALSALLTLLTYIYYNVTFLQHQGRYLFTALIPIAIFVAAGWERALELRTGRIVAAALLVWAAALGVWGLAGMLLSQQEAPKWQFALTLGVAVALFLANRLPEKWRRWASAVPFAVLPLIAVYALLGAIVPALASP